MRHSMVLGAVAIVGLLLGASFSQADVVYDFNSLTVGDLKGQDGWTSLGGNKWVVATAPGTGSLAIVGDTAANTKVIARPLDAPLVFNPGDCFVETVQIYPTTKSAVAYAGVLPADNTFLSVGLSTMGSAGSQTILRRGASDQLFGDGFADVANHWLEFQLQVDLRTTGGLGTVFYRDITAGQETFTMDSVLRNVPLGIAQNEFGQYVLDHFDIREKIASTSQIAYIDNISLMQIEPPEAPAVPEPSTLAILSAGLLGLLACARQKQK